MPRIPALPVLDTPVASDFRLIPTGACSPRTPNAPPKHPLRHKLYKRTRLCGKFFEGFDVIVSRNPHFGYAERAFALETPAMEGDFTVSRVETPRKNPCQIRADFLHIEAAAGHGAHIALGHQLV